VDQTALLAALKERRLAGAALDVFPEEPLPEDSPLWKAPNLVLTPHISGISTKFDERILQLFLENLRRYLAGQSLLNVFDPERGY
jgi:phosphoglycerate dehydrogenase-like enzyme